MSRLAGFGFVLVFGPLEAMKRSWERTRGHRGKILVANAILVIVGRVADSLLGPAEMALWDLPLWESLSPEAWTWITNLVVFAATLVVYPIAWIPQRVLPMTVFVKLRSA